MSLPQMLRMYRNRYTLPVDRAWIIALACSHKGKASESVYRRETRQEYPMTQTGRSSAV